MDEITPLKMPAYQTWPMDQDYPPPVAWDAMAGQRIASQFATPDIKRLFLSMPIDYLLTLSRTVLACASPTEASSIVGGGPPPTDDLLSPSRSSEPHAPELPPPGPQAAPQGGSIGVPFPNLDADVEVSNQNPHARQGKQGWALLVAILALVGNHQMIGQGSEFEEYSLASDSGSSKYSVHPLDYGNGPVQSVGPSKALSSTLDTTEDLAPEGNAEGAVPVDTGLSS